MNEVTRIHIAKVPYDIELAAKKDLEKYIHAVERYAGDTEIVQDIEIRITELLAERGVGSGGVITSADVADIRTQLGEPIDFADDPAAEAALGADSNPLRRMLYRDTDHAILGGVLAGIAAFYKVNPLWVRLAFLVLLVFSFGTAAVLYILFWIIVPPAHSAAEKLQLAGKPVTLRSIRDLNEQEYAAAPSSGTAKILQHALLAGLGILSTLAAIGTAAGTTLGLFFGVRMNPLSYSEFTDFIGGWGPTVLVLFALAGLLLAALFALVAYAAFTRKLTKKLVISGVSIIAAGLIAVGTGAGITYYRYLDAQQQASTAITQHTLQLPAGFENVTHLVIAIDTSDALQHMPVEYVAGQTPRALSSTMPGDRPAITVNGTTARVSFSPKDIRYRYAQPSLKIFGPELASVTVEAGNVTYHAKEQDAILLTSKNQADISLDGTFTSVTAKATDTSTIFLAGAAIENLAAETTDSASISAGTVRTLEVTQPEICSAWGGGTPATVTVQGISGRFSYNGKEQPTMRTHETSCGSVVITDRDDDEIYTQD